MRKPLVGLSLAALILAGVGAARAADVTAEPIPPDFIQQFAPFAVQLIQQQFPNAPVKVDPQTDKAQGFHVKEMLGVVMMPDKNLTAEAIEKAADKDVPVAVLATKGLSVQNKDAVVGADKVAVADFNGMFKIPVFFLAIRGKGDDRTLEVYSKDGTSIDSVPVKKMAGDKESPCSIKISNIDIEKKKMDVIFSLGGAYETTVKLGSLDL